MSDQNPEAKAFQKAVASPKRYAVTVTRVLTVVQTILIDDAPNPDTAIEMAREEVSNLADDWDSCTEEEIDVDVDLVQS